MTEDRQQSYGLRYGEIENMSGRMGYHGVVGSAVVAEADRLLLYWNGPLPEAITSLIEASGLTVDVHAVPYPADALHGAARSTFSRPGVNGAGFTA